MYVIIIFKENINCLGLPSLSPSNLFSSPLVSAYTFRILTGFLLNQCKLRCLVQKHAHLWALDMLHAYISFFSPLHFLWTEL